MKKVNNRNWDAWSINLKTQVNAFLSPAFIKNRTKEMHFFIKCISLVFITPQQSEYRYIF